MILPIAGLLAFIGLVVTVKSVVEYVCDTIAVHSHRKQVEELKKRMKK